ncbi:hypothetical protein CG717_07505 [Streptomyces sp. CB02613]|nr:hypothetical protein CG717_07505 [Streptomyces sp. CB02613]
MPSSTSTGRTDRSLPLRSTRRPSGLNAGSWVSFPSAKSAEDNVISGFFSPEGPLARSQVRTSWVEYVIRRRPSGERILPRCRPSFRAGRSITASSGWTAAAVSAARASGTPAIRQEARPSSCAVSGSVPARLSAACATARAVA